MTPLNPKLNHGLALPGIWNTTAGGVEQEHIHANTWCETVDLHARDHGLSVGSLGLCGAKPKVCDVKIGSWCAVPLPVFSDWATCL
jgi:hypothetical protein